MNTSIYSGPVFEMARQQFEQLADHLQILEMERSRLLYRSVQSPCRAQFTGTMAGLRFSRLSRTAPSYAWPDQERNPVRDLSGYR